MMINLFFQCGACAREVPLVHTFSIRFTYTTMKPAHPTSEIKNMHRNLSYSYVPFEATIYVTELQGGRGVFSIGSFAQRTPFRRPPGIFSSAFWAHDKLVECPLFRRGTALVLSREIVLLKAKRPLKGRFFWVFIFLCLLLSERGNGKEAGSRVAQDLADIR